MNSQYFLLRYVFVLHEAIAEEKYGAPTTGIGDNYRRKRMQTTNYNQVVDAVGSVFRERDSLIDEYDRAYYARKATADEYTSALLFTNPDPYALEELSSERQGILAQNVGPDFLRLRTIPLELTRDGNRPLVVGGSCAIETWGMRLIEKLKQGQKETIPQIAESLLSMAPTWSHVTGALLTGADVAVHYWEDRLWAQRLSEWGVADAQELVRAGYKRIHEAVARRARLINQNSVLLDVSFDDLDLHEGPIQRWCQDLGLPYNPQFGIADVMYTYLGTEILQLVRRAVRRRHPELYRLVRDKTHHTRIKQIDHNDWDSGVADIKSIILGGEPNEHQRKLLEGYPFQFGVKLASWVRTGGGRSQALVGGFFDMPGDGQVAHMQPDIWGARTILEQVSSSVRLTSRNVERHFAFLEGYLLCVKGPAPKRSEAEIEAKDGLKKSVVTATSEIAKAKTAIKRHADNLARMKGQVELLCLIVAGATINGASDSLNALLARLTSTQESIENREGEHTDEDKEDLADLKVILGNEREIHLGETGRIKDLQLVHKLTESLPLEMVIVRSQAVVCIVTQIVNERLLKRLEAEVKARVPVRDPLEPFTRRLWPLASNPFLWYATQFLWDADFREFIIKAVELDEYRSSGDSTEEKKRRRLEATEELQSLCIRLYPKLKRYLTYIMRGGDYPYDMIRRI